MTEEMEKPRKTNRSRDYYRSQRERVIKKRQNIVTGIWHNDDWERPFEQPGILDKHNLSCGCLICKYDKKMGIEKKKYKEYEQNEDIYD